MSNAAVKSTVYCLNHTPELGMQYGTTPYLERHDKPDSPFLVNLPKFVQTYGDAARYTPNLAYIGAMTLEQLEAQPRPWHINLSDAPTRFGKYGEIMPEDEFLRRFGKNLSPIRFFPPRYSSVWRPVGKDPSSRVRSPRTKHSPCTLAVKWSVAAAGATRWMSRFRRTSFWRT